MALPIFEANNYGYDILWVCFLMSMCRVQRGLNYRISSCNVMADWTIVMVKIYIVGLALATSELATTDLLDRTSFFQNVRLGRKVSFQDLTNTLGFQSGLFFTKMRLRTQLSATLALKRRRTRLPLKQICFCMFSMVKFTVLPIISKIIM